MFLKTHSLYLTFKFDIIYLTYSYLNNNSEATTSSIHLCIDEGWVYCFVNTDLQYVGRIVSEQHYYTL